MTSTPSATIPTFTGSFRENLEALVGVLESGDKDPAGKKIGFELERILIDRAGATVPFTGEHGVGALLEELARDRSEDERVLIDGHLLGLSYRVETATEPVAVSVSLEPAAQLEISAGPAHSVQALYEAVCAFDAEVERACATIGLDARLVPVGYNPVVSSPLDLELIPKERYRDMDAYLSRRGRSARDMMRCTASTQVSLDYEDEADCARRSWARSSPSSSTTRRCSAASPPPAWRARASGTTSTSTAAASSPARSRGSRSRTTSSGSPT